MRLFIISLLLSFSSALIAEGIPTVSPADSVIRVPNQKSKHPTVFLIGDNTSNAFEELSMEYEFSLIQAFENDMDAAYREWMDMMCAMEAFAKRKQFDIQGVKTWIKVFWSADGEINHIAYHLKPNSRNISTAMLSRFFKDFSKLHSFEVKSNKVFSHYGSASFPNYYCPKE